MKIFIIATIILLFLNSSPADAGNVSSAWDRFIAQENGSTYRVLMKGLVDCPSAICKNSKAPTSAQLHILLARVGRLDPYAIDITFRSLPFLGGGDSEDATRALNDISEKEPKMFLDQLSKHQLSERRITQMVGMLPEDTVDNIPLQIRTVDIRTASIESAQDCDPETKEIVLHALESLRVNLIQ